MLLVLTALDQQSQSRTFSCHLPELEVAFDVLSQLVALGNTLTQAYILEEGIRTDLPLAAFTGEDFLAPLQAMENQWQSLLTQPVGQVPAWTSEHLAVLRKRVDLYKTQEALQQQMIDHMVSLLVRTKKNFSVGPFRSRLISQYEIMLTRHRASLLKTQLAYRVLLERVDQVATDRPH